MMCSAGSFWILLLRVIAMAQSSNTTDQWHNVTCGADHDAIGFYVENVVEGFNAILQMLTSITSVLPTLSF